MPEDKKAEPTKIAERVVETMAAVQRAEVQGREARTAFLALTHTIASGNMETARMMFEDLDKAAGLVMVRSLNVVRAHTALLEALNGNDPMIAQAVEALKDTH